jgi:DNA invertase Pin-like site-specific DNA recombinase
MVDYAKKHTVIFDITDRMTRNEKDKITIYELMHFFDKTVHFSRTNKVYNKSSSPNDEFMLDMEVLIAKKMSNDISRKTKMGMDEKTEQRIFPSRTPVGYLNNKETKAIDIDPISAPLIKEIFELTAMSRYSLTMLADEFYNRGLRVKRGNTYSKVGKATLHRIIHSKFYYGLIEWGNSAYQGNHTPIVSKELEIKRKKQLQVYTDLQK